MEEHSYTFAAIRGMQAGREYYIVMCPFKLIPKIFLFNEEELSPEMRAQRVVNKARIPEIAQYILDNPNEYCFSALTASVDGDLKFTPLNQEEIGSSVGKLTIGMSCAFVINDGQHRRAAIEDALKMNPSPAFGAEKIAVVLFHDRGLKRSQQMFADLNKYAVRPSNSIGVLYDHRDPLAELTRQVMSEVRVFGEMIEMEKTTISNRSRKLFTLSSLYGANRALLGAKKRGGAVAIHETATCISFWNEVASAMPFWEDIKAHKARPDELRRDYVHAHGVTLQALGHVGNILLSKSPKQWKNKILQLQSIDWSRTNTALWEGRAMIGGRMSASPANILLTAAGIKARLGVELTIEEKTLENKMVKL